jgi:protein-disulfide isomerase
VNAIYGWQVQGDLKEGIDRGVKDVPAFFVNDELVEGRPTFDNISKAIDAALKKSKRKPNVKQRA